MGVFHVPWNFLRLGLTHHGYQFPKKIWKWPVVYHGTPAQYVSVIVESHLKIKGGKKKALHGSVYGNGIYISPLWQYSQCYSEPELVNGQHCYPMLMCRADPDKIHKQSDEIWTVPSEH